MKGSRCDFTKGERRDIKDRRLGREVAASSESNADQLNFTRERSHGD